MSDEGPPLTLDQVRAAAAVGRLPELAHQLVSDHRWSALEVLLTMAATPTIHLPDVTHALQALVDALEQLPESDRKEAARELREAELHAATALARRADVQPLTDRHRRAMRAAAGLFATLAETRRAGELFEKAGDEIRAAEAWGELGDLDRMEACLARDEQRRTERLRVTDLRRRFEMLFSAGERLAAVNAALTLPASDLDSQDLVGRARETGDRLRRGRAVSLRLGDGRVLRVAALPAVIGREPTVELPVREPTVSRRHTRLSEMDGQVTVEDAGSRGGTCLAGFRVAGRLPLRDAGELQLGANCRLRFRPRPPLGVVLEGVDGLDRDYLAVVAPDPVEIGSLLGLTAPLQVSFAEGVARLERPQGVSFRVGGQLIGHRCDLLQGEWLESDDGLRIEVL
jgi:hypothetical protein